MTISWKINENAVSMFVHQMVAAFIWKIHQILISRKFSWTACFLLWDSWGVPANSPSKPRKISYFSPLNCLVLSCQPISGKPRAKCLQQISVLRSIRHPREPGQHEEDRTEGELDGYEKIEVEMKKQQMIQTGDEENWPEIGVHAANWKRKSDLASYMTMVKTLWPRRVCLLDLDWGIYFSFGNWSKEEWTNKPFMRTSWTSKVHLGDKVQRVCTRSRKYLQVKEHEQHLPIRGGDFLGCGTKLRKSSYK